MVTWQGTPGTTRLRPSPLLRGYVAVFGVVWLGGVLSFLVQARHVGSAIPFLTLMLIVWGFVFYRQLRVGVDGDVDRLVVRNRMRTRTFTRTDVEGFRQGTPVQMPFGAVCVFVLTRDGGTLPLDVTVRSTIFPGSRQKLERDLTDLRTWLTST